MNGNLDKVNVDYMIIDGFSFPCDVMVAYRALNSTVLVRIQVGDLRKGS